MGYIKRTEGVGTLKKNKKNSHPNNSENHPIIISKVSFDEHRKYISWLMACRQFRKFLSPLSHPSLVLPVCLFTFLPHGQSTYVECMSWQLEMKEQEHFLQLPLSPLKASPSLTDLPFPCFKMPLFCWRLCQEFPITSISLHFHCPSPMLCHAKHWCQKQEVQWKRIHAQSAPEPLYWEFPDSLAGWNEISLAAAAAVHGPVRMWHLTLSFKRLPALRLFHFAASGTQMLS